MTNLEAAEILRLEADEEDRPVYKEALEIAICCMKEFGQIIIEREGLYANFVEYVCSGIPNPAPYCLNKCDSCTNRHGWCEFNPKHCKGFRPKAAEVSE